MTEEDYRNMVIHHDKHIDSLSASISNLAGSVSSSNNKLDTVIDAITHQNVIIERMNNMENNVAESFKRAWGRLGKLEETSSGVGCEAAKLLHKEKDLANEKMKVANKRIDSLETDVKVVTTGNISGGTLRWLMGLLVFYSITFGVYAVTSLHEIDTALSSYIARDTEIRETTSRRLDDVVSILRDREGSIVTHHSASTPKF